MTSSRRHSPFAGAVWMMVAGLCFAAVNSLSQYVSFTLGLPSTQVAFHQYLIALVCLLPWLVRHGLRQSLMTNQLRLHLLRVALAVTGIQFWLWALAVPVPIWQGIALLMTSPLFATLGSALFLKEQVSRARILATLAGFVGAMLILAPWTDDFTLASLLPVAAALFWAGYSLLVRYQAASESSHTIVVYLLVFSTPFNAMLAIPEWQWPSETQWLLVAASGVLSALAQMSIARAYSVAEASFVQPFDFAKLPMNVLAGWLGGLPALQRRAHRPRRCRQGRRGHIGAPAPGGRQPARPRGHSRALRRLQTKVGIFEDDAFFRRDAHALGAQQEGIGRGFMILDMIGGNHRRKVVTQAEVRQQRLSDGAFAAGPDRHRTAPVPCLHNVYQR